MKNVKSYVSEFLKHVQLFDLIKYTYVRTQHTKISNWCQ